MIFQPFLPLLLGSFVYSVSSYSIAFWNACPATSIYLRYGSDMQYAEETEPLATGGSMTLSVSYSRVYYELYDQSNNLQISSTLTLTNENMNGLGFVYYDVIGCLAFYYTPFDSYRNSKSIVVFINGATVDKFAYVGDYFVTDVSSFPGTASEMMSSTEIVYSDTSVKFCASDSDCVVSQKGSVTVPIGSALFIVNYLTSETNTDGYISFPTAGYTTVSSNWACPNCNWNWDDDDEVPARVIAAAVLGALFGICFLCCGIAYLVHLCNKKKTEENSPLPPLQDIHENDDSQL